MRHWQSDPEVAARVVRLLYAQSVMMIRRTVSRDEARVFSDDLASLLDRVFGGSGDQGDRGDVN